MLNFEKEKQFVCRYSNGGGGMRTDREWAVANASDDSRKSGLADGFLAGLEKALKKFLVKNVKRLLRNYSGKKNEKLGNRFYKPVPFCAQSAEGDFLIICVLF